MKKLTAAFLIVCLALCFAGCRRAPLEDETAEADTEAAVQKEQSVTPQSGADVPDGLERKTAEPTPAAEENRNAGEAAKSEKTGKADRQPETGGDKPPVPDGKQKEPVAVTEEADTQAFDLSNLGFDSEVFVGKVIAASGLVKPQALTWDVECLGYTTGSEIEIYTIEVTNPLWTRVAPQGACVRVVRFISDRSEEYWIDRLNVGETCLISGFIHQIDGMAVILDNGMITSTIKDGALIPKSHRAEGILDGIATYDGFINAETPVKNNPVKEDAPYVFRNILNDAELMAALDPDTTAAVEQAETDDRKILTILREAVKADSKLRVTSD